MKCKNCGRVIAGSSQRGMCDSCYTYWRHHKRMRPERLWRRWDGQCRVEPGETPCANCGQKPADPSMTRVRLCRACYNYQYKHGVPRPRELYERYIPRCDCGAEATRTLALNVNGHTTLYQLCESCAEMEMR